MMELRLICTLPRCNIDNSTNMNIKKCLNVDGAPCYYLQAKNEEQKTGDDVWGNFGAFVKEKGKNNSGNMA